MTGKRGGPTDMRPLKCVLIGGGAISRQAHLPALKTVPETRCVCLVDTDLNAARLLAGEWKIPAIADRLDRCPEDAEAVIIATPNHRHAPLALEALYRGLHVLCEKPLARTAGEAAPVVEEARHRGLILATGVVLRQSPGLRRAHDKFPISELGRVRSVTADYGLTLDWPADGDTLFNRERAGGGALIDQGSHLLDSLFWTFCVKSAEAEEYRDDGEGGVEAEGEGRLLLRSAHQSQPVPCRFRVSRLRRLPNSLRWEGAGGTLVVPLSHLDMPTFIPGGGEKARLLYPQWTPRMSWTDLFAFQLRDFARRVRGEPVGVADGESQLEILRMMERCYALRKPLRHPWEEATPWPL